MTNTSDPGLTPDEQLIVTLRGVLRTFSSRDSQLDYQRDVPGISVITELYCCWFDDVYHPELPGWAAMFSPDERRAFGRFSERLEECRGVVGNLELADVIDRPCWFGVMAGAKEAVEVMDGQARPKVFRL